MTDGAGFVVDPPNRQSFSPDVAGGPDAPAAFARDAAAHAGDAVPGRSMPVTAPFVEG